MLSRIDLGYRPRSQFISFHRRAQRWACIVAHRRAGKTVSCIMDLVDSGLRSDKKNPRFAYLAPNFNQAKDVAWTYLKQYTAPLPGCVPHESELRIDLPNGARIRLYGAENYDRMRGIYLDGIILDEYGDMDPRAWPEVIRPALSDRKGWATFIGTPKGRNGFFDIWDNATKSDDWHASMLKASETGIVAEEELADARRMMTPEQFAQEYECSFNAAIIGAYYGRELDELERQKRITTVVWEPTIPVTTAWDLGLNDATSIWFVQQVGNEVRVIDHYSVSNQSLVNTAKHVLSLPYLYKEHLLPHDVEIRELMEAKKRSEVLDSLGLRPIRAGAQIPVQEGINAVKMLLPRCVFDETKCAQGLESLRHYRSDYDERRKVFRTNPRHDWASHDADAFRELAVNMAAYRSAQSAPYRRARLGTMA